MTPSISFKPNYKCSLWEPVKLSSTLRFAASLYM